MKPGSIVGGPLLLFVIGLAVGAASAPSDSERLCDLEALHPEIPVYDECVSTTTTSPPTSTTSTSPSTTTTTAPSTTTTTVPVTTTTTMPVTGDQCVLDQIIRDQTRRNGQPKNDFDIINGVEGAARYTAWVAPYLTDLGNGYGWISGDRAGYGAAYMFLVNLETGENIARVSFVLLPEARGASGYGFINDARMDEIQTTNLGYAGRCALPGEQSQAQMPPPAEEYEPDPGPEVRPVILIAHHGQVVEDRSYTNTDTSGVPGGLFKFTDGGHITVPFVDVNGFGTDPHTVYERQTVLAHFDSGDGLVPYEVVYYDILVPTATILHG